MKEKISDKLGRLTTKENRKLACDVFVILLVSKLFYIFIGCVTNSAFGNNITFAKMFLGGDADWYIKIAENGYSLVESIKAGDGQANWAFFPLYVIVCAALKAVTGGLINTYVIGMIVSNICIIIAAFFAVKGLKKQTSIKEEYTMIMPVLLFMAPYTFYCSSVYTEAMFIMFIVLFFYFLFEKKYMAAGIMAACSSGTRIVGCILVFALVVQLYIDMEGTKISFGRVKTFVMDMFKAPKKILSVLVCPLGAFAYMAFLNFFCGDAWAYKNVQIAWRDDEYFPIIGVLWKACTGQIEPRYTYMGWFCIAILILYGYMFYRKYYSMAVFGIISLLVPLTSHVMSTCRFTAGTYVAFVGVYDILTRCNKAVRYIIMAVLIAIEIYLLFLWYNSDCWLM